jgi:hypothetical protein
MNLVWNSWQSEGGAHLFMYVVCFACLVTEMSQAMEHIFNSFVLDYKRNDISVVPKVCSTDPLGSATSSYGIRGYISIMTTL